MQPFLPGASWRSLCSLDVSVSLSVCLSVHKGFPALPRDAGGPGLPASAGRHLGDVVPGVLGPALHRARANDAEEPQGLAASRRDEWSAGGARVADVVPPDPPPPPVAAFCAFWHPSSA
jgi:hypothetical protein